MCRFIETIVFNLNPESEKYDKMIQSIISKEKDESWLNRIISGTICIKDIMSGTESYIVFYTIE